MNFSWLYQVVSEIQYDELKIIGRETASAGKPCHVAAMLRREEKVFICLLTQENTGALFSGTDPVMRILMREQAKEMEMSGIQSITVNGSTYHAGRSTGYFLRNQEPYGTMLMYLMAVAGWQVPQDSPFYEMDWNRMMLTVSELADYSGPLADWEHAKASLTWGPGCRSYLIEKPFTLRITDAQQETAAEQELMFIIAGEDGTAEQGICYINRAELVDMWKEHEAHYADPEYKKMALKHVTEEQFEETKRQSFRVLEQECPEGMCYIAIEYECTLDVSLDFYSREYLDSRPEESQSCTTFMLASCKPDQETGCHGMKMRAAMIRMPVAADTKEIKAELFLARRMIPEQEEELR